MLQNVEVIISAIGTGITNSGEPDIESIRNLSEMISPHLKSDSLLIPKTTLPIGSTRKIAENIAQKFRICFELDLLCV